MAKRSTKRAPVQVTDDGTVYVDVRSLTRQAMARQRRAELVSELSTGKLRAKTIPSKRRADLDWRRDQL